MVRGRLDGVMGRQPARNAQAIAPDDGRTDVGELERVLRQEADQFQRGAAQDTAGDEHPLLTVTSSLQGDAHRVRDDGEIVTVVQGPHHFGGGRTSGERDGVTSARQLGHGGSGDGLLGLVVTAIAKVDGQLPIWSSAASPTVGAYQEALFRQDCDITPDGRNAGPQCCRNVSKLNLTMLPENCQESDHAFAASAGRGGFARPDHGASLQWSDAWRQPSCFGGDACSTMWWVPDSMLHGPCGRERTTTDMHSTCSPGAILWPRA